MPRCNRRRCNVEREHGFYIVQEWDPFGLVHYCSDLCLALDAMEGATTQRQDRVEGIRNLRTLRLQIARLHRAVRR